MVVCIPAELTPVTNAIISKGETISGAMVCYSYKCIKLDELVFMCFRFLWVSLDCINTKSVGVLSALNALNALI